MPTVSAVGMGMRRVRALREMTQEDAAASAGVVLRTWQRWESGEQEPRADAVQRALGLSLDELQRIGAHEPD